MAQLSHLVNKMPQFKEARMVASGYGLWVSWSSELNPAVNQTLLEYGGLHLQEDREQALWFFFSTDIFLALARLAIWAKFNSVPVFMQVFPTKMLFSSRRELNLAVDGAISGQVSIIPDDLEIWVHHKAREDAKAMPGLSFESHKGYTGLANADWSLLHADSRLPYQSSLGWFGVIKPVGNPLEKGFQEGWREFWKHIESIFEKLKIKFIIHEFYVIFQIDSLRKLRIWCKEYLNLIFTLKEENPNAYWPCVQALMDRKGLNFNNELPKKVRLDWDQLVPDFPHMSYRNAYLLGEGFEVHDVRFSVESSRVDDWCNVNLVAEGEESVGILPVEVSNRLVAGANQHCFYCGLRTHEPHECPTRRFEELDFDIWKKVAKLDFDALNSGFKQIDKAMAAGVHEGVDQVLASEGDDSTLLKAIFGINANFQFRMAQRMWLARGKDYPQGLHELAPKDEHPIWGALGLLQAGELVAADKELQNIVIRNPRDFRARTLNGFVALERGDPTRAQALWKEAETYSTSPLHQAYHIFLQGRNLEIQGRYQKASNLFKQVMRLCPAWNDALYRQAVCQVKMGFAEQAMGFISNLIERDPNMFNRVLLDPEMERGHLQLLSALHGPWTEAESKVEDTRKALEHLQMEVGNWFQEDHPFAEEAHSRAAQLLQRAGVKNFVSFVRLLQGKERLERDMQIRINHEARELKSKFKHFMERLVIVRDEAAWFPFPRVLVDFNKDYNLCAANLNWALKTHFQVADTFKRAQKVAETEDERLERLESRLRFLRVVRDSTLYLLIMGKTFFWIELFFLITTLVALPLTIYYGDKTGAEWASGLLVKQKWQIQKGLILILSVVAFAFAALRTALVFDKVRAKLFRQAQGK